MAWLILLNLLIICGGEVNAQIISTIAGGGSGGDGIPATASSIHCPQQMTIDVFGNIYFTQTLTHKVRKIDTFGIISTIAGTGTFGFSGDGGPASLAVIRNPSGITTDTIGNIYFCDQSNHRIRKIDAVTGIITTVAGTGIGGYNGDGIPATSAHLQHPWGVSFDKSGNLYISDPVNFRIRKVDVFGKITTVAGIGLMGSDGDGGPATAAKLEPVNIDFDKNGNMYIHDGACYCVRKVTPAGIISTIAGNAASYIYNGDEIPATAANLSPKYIAIGKDNLLYIPDAINNRVRVIDASGFIHTVAGNGTAGFAGDGGLATNAQVRRPNTIAFDKCGNLYIAQMDDPRIRKVTFNPPPCTYLSVDEQSVKKEVTIYPNPANDELHINTSPGLSNGEVMLCNMLGQVVLTEQLNSNHSTITIKHLPPGLYMLALTDEEGKRTVHKIVKE